MVLKGEKKERGEEVREGYKEIPIFIFHLKGCVEEGGKWWGVQDIPSHRFDIPFSPEAARRFSRGSR